MTDADLSDTGEAEADDRRGRVGTGTRAVPDYNDKRHSPERLLFLADGVFAISMTLLAIDVRIPDGVLENRAAYAEHSGELYRGVLVFIAAFLITSRFWVGNHKQMRLLHHADNGVIERTMMFLAGICSIPVATSVLFHYGKVPAAITFAAIVLAGTAVLSARLWWYVSSPARDLASVTPRDRRRVMTRMILVVLVYLSAIPVAWLLPDPSYAPVIWLLMAVIDGLADRISGAIEGRRASPGPH